RHDMPYPRVYARVRWGHVPGVRHGGRWWLRQDARRAEGRRYVSVGERCGAPADELVNSPSQKRRTGLVGRGGAAPLARRPQLPPTLRGAERFPQDLRARCVGSGRRVRGPDGDRTAWHHCVSATGLGRPRRRPRQPDLEARGVLTTRWLAVPFHDAWPAARI